MCSDEMISKSEKRIIRIASLHLHSKIMGSTKSCEQAINTLAHAIDTTIIVDVVAVTAVISIYLY